MAHRESGHIKWFSKDQGFGFIHAPGRPDHFFHITHVQGSRIPNTGDAVTFESSRRDDGRRRAMDIEIVKVAEPSAAPTRSAEKPYYGRQTFEYEKNKKYLEPGGGVSLGLVVGLLVGYFIFDGGWLLNSVLAIALAGLGRYYEVNQKESPYIQGQEITSTCLKCGGTGQVTATQDGYTGFQCPRCKSFWKKVEKRS